MDFKLGPNTVIDLRAGLNAERFEYEASLMDVETTITHTHRVCLQRRDGSDLWRVIELTEQIARQSVSDGHHPQGDRVITQMVGFAAAHSRDVLPHLSYQVRLKIWAVVPLLIARLGIAAHFTHSSDFYRYVRSVRNLSVVAINQWHSESVIAIADWCAELGGAHAH